MAACLFRDGGREGTVQCPACPEQQNAGYKFRVGKNEEITEDQGQPDPEKCSQSRAEDQSLPPVAPYFCLCLGGLEIFIGSGWSDAVYDLLEDDHVIAAEGQIQEDGQTDHHDEMEKRHDHTIVFAVSGLPLSALHYSQKCFLMQ